MKVDTNLEVIKQSIDVSCRKSNRNPEEIRVIAVTKYVTIERTIEALDAGINDLGESRTEGLQSKWNVLKDKPCWHFIGTLQTRKVREMIDKVEYIHSLDRESLAKEINQRANGRKISCLVQVNVSGEQSKHGLNPELVLPFIHSIKKYENITVVGLMTMAPLTEDEELIRACFKRLKQIQVEVQGLQLPYAPCQELSMGMSNDYGIAIEEGSTMIRIGTALVGE